MRQSFLIISILSTFIFLPQAKADVCQDWFDTIKIKSDCEAECRISKVDMSNYLCRNECENLCNNHDLINKYYLLRKYGLTKEEILICNSNKILCAKAYQLSWDSEKACNSIFNKSKTNDESDACRHYVWAVLLAKNLGHEFAEKILTAHENNPESPPEERAMDLSNNRLGLIDYQNIKKVNWTTEEVLNLFKTNLKNNKIIVLKPSTKDSGEKP